MFVIKNKNQNIVAIFPTQEKAIIANKHINGNISEAIDQTFNQVFNSTEFQERMKQEVRGKRNQLLCDCDWTQMPDSPLSSEQKLAWATYRQSLRDLTDAAGFPQSVEFPTAP